MTRPSLEQIEHALPRWRLRAGTSVAPSRRTRLEREAGPAVELEWSSQFDTLVLWTLPGQPFVCVEPWSGRGGVPAERVVAPGGSEHLSVVLRSR